MHVNIVDNAVWIEGQSECEFVRDGRELEGACQRVC